MTEANQIWVWNENCSKHYTRILNRKIWICYVFRGYCNLKYYYNSLVYIITIFTTWYKNVSGFENLLKL